MPVSSDRKGSEFHLFKTAKGTDRCRCLMLMLFKLSFLRAVDGSRMNIYRFSPLGAGEN